MPVYNVEPYIAKSISGVLNQTFKDFELIILDDASTDNTVNIIQSFYDRRIILIRDSTHQGLIAQLNRGLKIAQANLIARMDGDDLHHVDRLTIQYEFLKNFRNIDAVGSNIIYIDENDRPIIEKTFPEYHQDIEFMMPFIPAVIHGSLLIRKKALISVEGYDPQHFCEDINLFLQLLKKGYKFYNIQKPLLYYRILKKDIAYTDRHYRNYYQISKQYLQDYYSKIPDNQMSREYYYRMGLVEYYLGKNSQARKYFFKSILYPQFNKRLILRHLIPSLLPDVLMVYLRRKRVLERLNFLIKKLFDIDTNFIKNPLKKR